MRNPIVDRRAKIWPLSPPLFGILTVFWVYVTLTNVLYVHGLSAGIDPTGAGNFFARWDARVLQHALLYPVLLACAMGSLRIGWKPLWRALPIQLLIAIAFSSLATPLLALSEHVMDPALAESHPYTRGSLMDKLTPSHAALWLSGALNFELTYYFALALIHGFTFYRRFRDSEVRFAALERAWSDARLGALRAQLSPHTLFNLLHTIRGQIGWDPAAAQAMIVQLSDLLRRLLNAGQQEFSRLRDELQFVTLYLQLQQKRFERLTLTLPSIESLPPVWVPSLILQPLVENAVVHGAAGHEGPVSIAVAVALEEETLVLSVSNTVAPNRPRNTDGIGLRNVNERLAVHFGERASFNAGLAAPEQWRVEIRMPVMHEGPVGPARGKL